MWISSGNGNYCISNINPFYFYFVQSEILILKKATETVFTDFGEKIWNFTEIAQLFPFSLFLPKTVTFHISSYRQKDYSSNSNLLVVWYKTTSKLLLFRFIFPLVNYIDSYHLTLSFPWYGPARLQGHIQVIHLRFGLKSP